MTINTTTNRAEFSGDDVTTVFPFGYYFLAEADLVVIETVIATGFQTTKTLTTHYTVSGEGNPAGGSVTMLTAPASTVTLTIYRDPSAIQDVDLVEGDPLPVETAVEQPLDKLTMIVQRIKEVIGRSLRLPEGDTGFVDADMYLPAEVDRASKYFGFDADGKPIATAGTTSIPVVSAFMETVLDDASAAAARTTLGVPSNAEAILDSLLTTTGDMVYASGAATPARLAVGTASQVLVGGATPAWGTVPSAAITAVPAAAIPTAAQADQETPTSTALYVTPGRQQFHASACKAWVKFNGTGTVAVYDSYNLDPTTPLTDNNTGDYSINFATDFSSVNYSGVGNAGTGAAPSAGTVYTAAVGTYASGAARVCTHDNNLDAVVDAESINFHFFGDQ
jgi:hypothetical protein